ncbi:kinase-like domain-containing protein [Sphaerosporella brunnea]|uniref:Kinase-like domain-containing protein n=1 Tax=Sphaerosporella brunnea TaxID=1250544 RepID=A0A5J5F4X8_9PEZI|nr:kinase-like domain-containing protein [Sphaerosporella brunnea]
MASSNCRALARLMVSIRGQPTQEITLHKKDLLVGRANYCDIIIPHRSCSHRQFRLYATFFDEGTTEPLIYCEDQNSSNGTWINSHSIPPDTSVLLSHGDRIDVNMAASFVFLSSMVPEALDEQSLSDGALFEDAYQLTNRLLGSGTFGRVLVANEKETGLQVACKIIDLARYRERLKREIWEVALREVMILSGLSHPNIVNIRHVVMTDARIYIFQDLITNGDLFALMADRGSMMEWEALPLVWQILKALIYLHQSGVVHRDLKPENILCTSCIPGGRIILTDFGTAREVDKFSRLSTIAGTHEYNAPEMISRSKGYSKEVDLWSLGIIVHNLLIPHGVHGCSAAQLKEQFEGGNFCWLDRSNLRSLAKDFIKSLLCVNPKERLTAEQALHHPWLSRYADQLDKVYQRNTATWKGRDRSIMIVSFVTDPDLSPTFAGIPRPVSPYLTVKTYPDEPKEFLGLHTNSWMARNVCPNNVSGFFKRKLDINDGPISPVPHKVRHVEPERGEGVHQPSFAGGALKVPERDPITSTAQEVRRMLPERPRFLRFPQAND